MWVFDMADGGGRLLRERSGHSEPPIKLRFHGNNGQMLLSAGTWLICWTKFNIENFLIEINHAIKSINLDSLIYEEEQYEKVFTWKKLISMTTGRTDAAKCWYDTSLLNN